MKLTIGFVICLTIFILTFGYPTPNKKEEENDDCFEGGLDHSLEQTMAIEKNSLTGIINEEYRWPNKTVRYEFANGHFDEALKKHVLLGMQTIEKVSCVRFIPADENTKVVVIITSYANGCYADVGYNGKEQIINLELNKVNKGCFQLGTIVHELLHTLGFYHQENAADRDDYVKIEVENIMPGKDYNFMKHSSTFVGGFDIGYDYGSIMHSGAKYFSRNENKTIIPIPDEKVEIGQRRGMSLKDINKLNIMYKCPIQTIL